MKNIFLLFFFAAVLLGAAILAWGVHPTTLFSRVSPSVAPPSDSTVQRLAQWLSDKKVEMYGAYWGSHCQNQKKMFGDAFATIRYVECARSDNSRAQTQECLDADIKGYPTWIFPDGSRLSGEQPLSELARAAGCSYENP